jgi:hypothetical protein
VEVQVLSSALTTDVRPRFAGQGDFGGLRRRNGFDNVREDL